MLGGGARGLHHFTEMVGGDIHVTINWRGAAEELVRRDPPVVYRMDTPIPDYAVNELLRIPVFRMAFEEGGLAVEEFADYGPVRYFRDSFEAGWSALLEAIAARRKEQEGS
jgi:transaldolase